MPRSSRRLAAAGLLLPAVLPLALLAACTPEAPPTPTPTPTSASPTETEQERSQREAYRAAEATLRSFRSRVADYLNDGGAKATPPDLEMLAGGPILKSASMTLRQAYEIGGRTVGRARIVSVVPLGYSPAELSLRTCEDGHDVRVMQGKKELGRGEIAEVEYSIRKSGNGWKVWDSENEVVKSC